MSFEQIILSISASQRQPIAFGDDSGWQRPLVDYGRWYAQKVARDYNVFVSRQKERK